MNTTYGLYTVWDKIAEEGCPPFMARTDGQAVRVFNSMKIEDKDDYLLYRIGTYDPFSLEITHNDKSIVPYTIGGEDV